MPTFSDQDTFNLDVHGKLNVLLERTQNLAEINRLVTKHETELENGKWALGIIGMGTVGTLVAFIKHTLFGGK